MNDVKVSIIIPIYNAEKYLQETLDSIATQSFRDFEVILVNDGSKDHSLEIMQKFQNSMPNVVIFNQANAGVSTARNNGLKLACGEYVCFVDADDILHQEYLETLYNIACNGADVVSCEYDIFYHTNQIIMDLHQDVEVEELYHKYSGKTFDYLMDMGYGVSPCIKMYRAEIIKKYNILFDEKSTFGEDMFFNWKVFLVSHNIYYVKKKLYYYRQALGTATERFHAGLFESYAREYQSIRDFADENNLDKEQVENSINNNLLKRVPSFLRMNMRGKGGIVKKLNGVKELVNKKEIQNAICEYEKHEKLNKELRAIRDKKYLKVFCYGCIYEYRFRIARFIKNLT